MEKFFKVGTCYNCKKEVVADGAGNMKNNCKCGATLFSTGFADELFLFELEEIYGYKSCS